ncbi:MAG: tetratricopeptide repeat protein [bacterium]|nr:tetratricopeptide repeat protein [bacterium]
MAIWEWLKNRDVVRWLPPVLVGALLRFWGLGFGLPNFLRPDEDMVVLPALGMIGGDLDPYDYTYPTLYKYVLALIFRLAATLGVGPDVEAPWQYAAYGFLVDGSFFVGIARGVTAILGSLTVLVVYWIGKEGYGRFVGVAGAWFCAVSVLHVRDSHFGVTDVPSVCLLMFGVLYALRITRGGNLRDYIWSGVFVGLATGTKYGSVLGVIPILVAHFCIKPRDASVISQWMFNRRIWIAFGVAGAIFILVSPYVLLRLDGFKRDFGFQVLHLFEFGHGEDLGSGWWYHLKVSLRYGLGWGILVLGVFGVGIAAARRSASDWVVLSLLLVFYAITGQGKAVFFRYVLPIIPLLCVLAGVCVDRLRKSRVLPIRYAGLWGVAFLVAGLLEPLWASVRLNRLLDRSDTRVLARAWVEDRIFSGAEIKNVGGLFGDVTLRSKSGISWWLARYCRAFPEVSGDQLAAFWSRFDSKVVPIYQYTIYPGQEDLMERSQAKKAPKEIPASGWVITHEHPLYYSVVDGAFLNWLDREAHLYAKFSPGSQTDVAGAIFDRQDAFYYPIGRFGDLERGGPLIRIWRIKGSEEAAQKTEELGPLLGWIFLSMGNFRQQAGDLERAELFFRRASEILSDQANVYLLLGRVYFQKMELDAGVKAFEQALKLGARIPGEVHGNLGAYYVSNRQFSKAIASYEQAVQMGYEQADGYNNLGAAYFQVAQYDRAENAVQKALVLDPNHEEAQANLKAIRARKEGVP